MGGEAAGLCVRLARFRFRKKPRESCFFSWRASSPRTRKSCASWHVLFAGSPLRLLFRNYIIAARAGPLGLRTRKFHQLEYQLFPGTQPLFTFFFFFSLPGGATHGRTRIVGLEHEK